MASSSALSPPRNKHRTRFVWTGYDPAEATRNTWRGTCSCGWEGSAKTSINDAIGSMLAHERYYRRRH